MSTRSCRTCGASFEGDGRRRYCSKHAPAKRVRKKARPQHLHAIGPGEKPPVRRAPRSIAEAAEAESPLDELRLMRMRIARTLDDPNCPPRDLAALSRRQIEISREIEALKRQAAEEEQAGGTAADEAWDSEAI